MEWNGFITSKTIGNHDVTISGFYDEERPIVTVEEVVMRGRNITSLVDLDRFDCLLSRERASYLQERSRSAVSSLHAGRGRRATLSDSY